MATQYTSLLGLALPVTGELSGSWGDVVNDSITSLLDSAISGTTSFTTDADTTLTTTTGAANQARQAIILWNPASGTTTRNITAPAQSKIYTVINASGGTQSIVFRGAGPTTGVTIVQGESAVVAWNGSDFIKISNAGGSASFTNVTVSGTTTLSGLTASTALALDASKNVVSVTNTGTGNNVLSASPTLTGTISGANASLSGTLGVTGVATLTAQPILSSLTTSQAVFTDGSKGLVSNAITGTGNVVMSTSPTLVTPALGTPSSVTLTNATGLPVSTGISGLGTGVATALAVNVGTAGSPVINGGALGTPSSGTVTNLTGTASININGTVGATTANTGAFTTLSATGNVTLGDASTDTVTVNGYMGVGGAGNSAYGLYIQNAALSGASQIGVLSDVTGTSASTTLLRAFVGRTNTAAASFTVSDAVQFYANNSIKGAGSTITNQHGLYITDQTQGTNNYGITSLVSSGTNKWNIYASGTAQNYFAGNVGIGTSSPASNLQIRAANPDFYITSDNTGQADIFFGGSTAPTKGLIRYSDNSDFFAFSTNSSERMRIDSSGNVGIGTSSPTTGARLQVSGGNVTTDSAFNFSENSSTPVSQAFIHRVAASTLAFGTASTERLRIDSAGNVGIGTTSPGSILAVTAASPTVTLTSTTTTGTTLGNKNNRILLSADSGTAGNGGEIVWATADVNNRRWAAISGSIRTNDGGGGATGSIVFATKTLDADTTLTERLRIDYSGNVGIGTSSPEQKLDVFGASGTIRSTVRSGTSFLTTFTSSTLADGSGIFVTAGGPLLFAHANTSSGVSFTERMRLDSSGNLGLGVTPSAWWSAVKALQVRGAAIVSSGVTNSSVANAFLNSSAAWTYYGTGNATHYEQTLGQHRFFTAPSGTAGNAISFTQAMTLDASGNLGIGTTSPGARLHLGGQTASAKQAILATAPSNLNFRLEAVNGDTGTAGGTLQAKFGLRHDDGSTNVDTAAFRFFRGSSASDGAIGFATNDTERMRLDSSGNLIQTVNTTAATLSTNGTLTFSIVDNSTLRISVRGSDGTTRTATVALT